MQAKVAESGNGQPDLHPDKDASILDTVLELASGSAVGSVVGAAVPLLLTGATPLGAAAPVLGSIVGAAFSVGLGHLMHRGHVNSST
jgi:hypothetical protein